MIHSERALLRVLEEARSLGFLGPGPVAGHLEHARGFARAAEEALGRDPRSVVDLGSGGGVPGLVLALTWSQAHITLIESMQRRARHLETAVGDLGCRGRVDVVCARAEVVAHDPSRREASEVVTARSFAPSAATAEIAAGFVGPGGAVVVSDPPDEHAERWPESGLASLGIGPAQRRQIVGAHYVVLRKIGPAPTGIPRGVGRPAKRPLW